MSLPTDIMYTRYARSAREMPQTVDFGHGAKGHWIGDKNAQSVLIWYHGRDLDQQNYIAPRYQTGPRGGFCLPANIGYFKFWADLTQSSCAGGEDLAIYSP